ncbi:MAG TPA: sigma factor-like helix-turn-helix DNA-binding protein [Mariniflexile sp.]|nr:sigma factor-like helix-turn-helix DNA-binding protein [Mariniflexile sp.]
MNNIAVFIVGCIFIGERCQEVFYENKILGLKYNEVAEKLQISIKTVEDHISRALGILKACMN